MVFEINISNQNRHTDRHRERENAQQMVELNVVAVIYGPRRQIPRTIDKHNVAIISTKPKFK